MFLNIIIGYVAILVIGLFIQAAIEEAVLTWGKIKNLLK